MCEAGEEHYSTLFEQSGSNNTGSPEKWVILQLSFLFTVKLKFSIWRLSSVAMVLHICSLPHSLYTRIYRIWDWIGPDNGHCVCHTGKMVAGYIVRLR